MKKLIYSFIVVGLGAGPVSAKQVTVLNAQQVAMHYVQQNARMAAPVLTLTYTQSSAAGEADYFVFNINSNSGFVIVPADDAARPVIGYSTEGNFVKPTATVNPEFYFWMEKRRNEIEYIRNNHLQPTAEITAEWAGYASNKISPPDVNAVAPLCQTNWGQSMGYNDSCPGGSLTGCAATAMAQIMKVWNFPAKGTGSHCYNAGSYGTLCVNPGATQYDWSNMSTSGSDAVAQLMYHCGVAMEMAYSPSGSMAYMCYGSSPSVENAFKTYFKYDPGLHCVDQAADGANWIPHLKTELNAGRAVMYQGVDASQGGHGWVCDGFDASNNFHMNWGWEGQDDGYFAVTSLTPSGSGMNFTQYLGGLLGIKPMTATGVTDNSTVNSFNVYPNPASDEITIEGAGLGGTVHYAICNMLGAEIMSGNISGAANNFSEKISVGGLSNGIYFLKFSDVAGSSVKKLNKQ